MVMVGKLLRVDLERRSMLSSHVVVLDATHHTDRRSVEITGYSVAAIDVVESLRDYVMCQHTVDTHLMTELDHVLGKH